MNHTINPLNKTARLREIKAAVPNSPDLGCPRSPTMLLELEIVDRDNRDPCAYRRCWRWRNTIGACIHPQAPGDCEGWVLLSSGGVNSSEASPHSLFARRRSCAPRALWGSAPALAFPPGRLLRGRLLRTLSPCCSTKWSVDSPKVCLASMAARQRRIAASRCGAPWQQKLT
jgi:hypothetical protein